VYYQPFFDGPPFANSLENVEIKLEDAAFQNIASITADQGSQAPFFEWTPLVLDLSAVPDAELQSVQRIALSITPIDFGAGTVLFDDITASLSDESPLDLNGDGSVDSGDIVTLISAAPLERIEDFEGFADTAELAAAITDATPNATIELDPMAGVDNSAALVATGENGSDPFFTQFTLDTDDFSLAGVDQVSLAGRFLSGSNEDVRVELLDDVGGTIAEADLGSVQALPTDSFATLPIVTDFSSATVFSVRFTLDAVDFGTTSVAIDNITSGDPVSDFNGDGAGNIFDLIDYLEEFDAN